ncbi:uncharacterized protein SAPINGB_P000870 [Magnusiomyces paraingens]|uniref:Uncharacterized protein n=1 Tax=Magnusiomyces paraingens TaxID=2606893 RepID=A0A5E8B2Q5_9ASCO|nr:uncharacterized protein SAPINGB_P000870 [Saprochaete ingens]VVT45746.1 unnamed protein product [Saprochaete ingens]
MASKQIVPPFKNIYHKRLVAQASSRACFICCKPTATVLVSNDGKDTGFATPVIDQEVENAKSKLAQIEPEITALTQSVTAKRKEAEPGYLASFFKKKSKDTEKKDDKKDSKKDDKEENKETSSAALTTNNSWDREQALLDKLLETQESLKAIIDKPPRVFNLDKHYYIMRINSHRSAQLSKKVDQMLSNPLTFPKVPTHIPGSEQKQEPKSSQSPNGSAITILETIFVIFIS